MPEKVVLAEIFEKNEFCFVKDVPVGMAFRIADTGHDYEIYIKVGTLKDKAGRGVNCVQIGYGLTYLSWNIWVQQLEVG